MAMPKNCDECPIKAWEDEWYVCPFSGVTTLSIGCQDNCPLVEIPPNGRLIDASKLNITKRALDAKRDYLLLAEKDMDCEYEQGFLDGLAVACGEIRKAKTIIPADMEG